MVNLHTQFAMNSRQILNFIIFDFWTSAANSFIDIPASEPWFEQWSEIFLSVQPPADHEYTRHFLSCLILLSSADPNIIETANDLTRSIQMMQTAVPPKMPKFFSTDALNCYVLLHDRSLGGDISL